GDRVLVGWLFRLPFFFFSSRRRHTRFSRDWSSDVCSSDLYYSHVNTSSPGQLRCSLHETIRGHTAYPYSGSGTSIWTILEIADRSEERRVGKARSCESPPGQ